MKKSFLASLTCALMLAACQPAAEENTEPIKIGYLGPLTGDAAVYGADTLNGVKLKVQEINDAGGINGRTVQVVAEDGRCTGSDSAAATQKLVHIDKVVAIIGGQCSGETLAAAPIANAASVVMISPLSTSPDVTNAGDFVFRTAPSDALKTKAMANYFAEQGYEKIAIISENTDFGIAFRNSLKADAGEDKFVFDEITEPGGKDFRTLFTRLQDIDFDIFVANGNSSPIIGSMLEQMRELGLTQQAITHDAGETVDIFDVAPIGSEGLLAINIPSLDDETEFGQKFIAAFGPAKSGLAFAGASYDATALIADAVNAHGDNGEAIRDYLYGINKYNGVIGAFGFDNNGDVTGINYKLTQASNGSFSKIADIVVN